MYLRDIPPLFSKWCMQSSHGLLPRWGELILRKWRIPRSVAQFFPNSGLHRSFWSIKGILYPAEICPSLNSSLLKPPLITPRISSRMLLLLSFRLLLTKRLSVVRSCFLLLLPFSCNFFSSFNCSVSLFSSRCNLCSSLRRAESISAVHRSCHASRRLSCVWHVLQWLWLQGVVSKSA